MLTSQDDYLNQIRKEKNTIFIGQLIICISFIIIWEVLAHYKIINSFIFSCPTLIIKTIYNLITNGSLFEHLFITLSETIIAFLLGLFLAFIIAIIMYLKPLFAKIIEPFLTMLNSLPKVALGPIIIIWFGANTKSIIGMALLINLIIGIINIYNGFVNTDAIKIKLLQTYRATNWQILTKLVIPHSFKNIIACLKINISMTLIGVIMGEFLVSKAGIGYLIMYGTQVFNLNLVMSGILLLIIISSLLYFVAIKIEKKLLK